MKSRVITHADVFVHVCDADCGCVSAASRPRGPHRGLECLCRSQGQPEEEESGRGPSAGNFDSGSHFGLKILTKQTTVILLRVDLRKLVQPFAQVINSHMFGD